MSNYLNFNCSLKTDFQYSNNFKATVQRQLVPFLKKNRMPTYYEVLGVSETASTDFIKQRFHQLILEVRILNSFSKQSLT